MTSGTPPDLQTFERKRTVPLPRRRLLPWVLPTGVVAAFLLVLAWSLRDVLVGATEVTVVRPIPAEGRTDTPVAGPTHALFQAAGWVEPDPFPRLVAPLTDGVVLELRVEESDAIEAGDVVAVLVDDEARLELAAADAAVAAAVAARAHAKVDLDAARERFDASIERTERLEVAAAAEKARRDEEELERAAAARAVAEVTVAEEELRVEEHLAREGAAGPRQVELARARLEAARAAREGAGARARRAGAEREAAEAVATAARRNFELRIDDRHAVEAARGAWAAADAEVARAEAQRDLARLRLERTEVRSPWAGVVLERLAAPGAGVTARDAICSLYDPDSLRVRVDVPFDDVDRTFVGQRAEIECEARPGAPYAGVVLRRVQRADIQKVTLEVQVRITDPDPLVRPDMLCQVRFLGGDAPGDGSGTPAEGGASRPLLVPSHLLEGDRLWVLDADLERARRRTVRVGASRDGLTEVLSGLNPTDKLIDEGRGALEDGARVRVREGSR